MLKPAELEHVLTQIPDYIFWKDKNFVFLGANSHFAHIAGFCNVTEITGKTDYDMPWGKTHADLYRTRDLEALNGRIVKNEVEPQLQANGKLITVIVNKAPLLNKKGRIIGVVGSFIELPDEFDTVLQNKVSLPESQKAVLVYVAKGLPAKVIAKKLNLSPRTIEFYISILKNKLSCRNKSELIVKAWKLGLMSHYVL